MKYSDPYVGCRSESGRLRWLLGILISVNLLWAVCFLKGGVADVEDEEMDETDFVDVEFEGGIRSKRSDYFDKEARGTKLIQFVREASWDWNELRRGGDDPFSQCPNYRNCHVKTEIINRSTKPNQIPNAADLVVFSAQALRLHRTSTYWSEAASLRGPLPPLWAILAMKSPYELNLDFLTEDHYDDADFEFNLTMTYKPDSDVFVPHDFWSWDGDDGGRGLNPRMVAASKNVGLELAANKTRQVLWTIDGPCKSVNNRMKYAMDLSKHVAVDIIGHCEATEHLPGGETKIRHRVVDYSTHPRDAGGRRGVPADYKFALAMEDISCRDYVSDAFFSVAKGMNVVPIVMGAQRSAYELLSPSGSFLHIDDFPGGPKELAAELKRLDGDDAGYARFFDHVGRGNYRGAPVSTLCRLCDLLNFLETGGDNVDASAFGNRDADDFSELWSPDDCNTNSLFKEGAGADDGDVFGSEFSNNEL